jgi:4'-phosphopantetheinyl transferase
LLLKELAGGMGVSDFSTLKDNLGQPYGSAGSQNYFVSIAHSDQTVFCGISEHQPIGIDIEPVNREVSERLKRRILHPDEGRLFSEMPIVKLWTIKEAYIKLLGQGLRMNMNQVHVRKEKDEFFVEINNDKRAKICSFQIQKNWLAIAYYQ